MLPIIRKHFFYKIFWIFDVGSTDFRGQPAANATDFPHINRFGLVSLRMVYSCVSETPNLIPQPGNTNTICQPSLHRAMPIKVRRRTKWGSATPAIRQRRKYHYGMCVSYEIVNSFLVIFLIVFRNQSITFVTRQVTSHKIFLQIKKKKSPV